MALANSGQLSLNEIHVEAGGTTGTQAALNDSDIRGLISKGSGAQNSISEYYGASAGAASYTIPAFSGQYNAKYADFFVTFTFSHGSDGPAMADNWIVDNLGNDGRGRTSNGTYADALYQKWIVKANTINDGGIYLNVYPASIAYESGTNYSSYWNSSTLKYGNTTVGTWNRSQIQDTDGNTTITLNQISNAASSSFNSMVSNFQGGNSNPWTWTISS